LIKKVKSLVELVKIVQSQGFGSRKESARLIQEGQVRVAGEICNNPKLKFPLAELEIEINDVSWSCTQELSIVLNKPKGFECSRAPQHYKSVFALLPYHLQKRAIQGAGRLDQDTSGLYILSDNGLLLHHLCSPKKHLPKKYAITLRHAINEAQWTKISEGVELRSEKGVFKPHSLKKISDKTLEMEILEGKYHQVKRMWSAAGNRIESLKRIGIGDFKLSDSLAEGQWQRLTEEDLCLMKFQA
jgi:16S rRNA pseudouridine516 synthase